ncbi:hypothetical protein BATDEDRAFT_26136 [Batrachochytrium dendrobatidis JAM81]|uniref:Uncharacterized protein n=1 Tax=Batrachochytrium dendrobatidis (strain JAM81 / FGSC 10211) TaxID=684364 RepID=F4P6K2_BATDJ|nr:uncharacterized protein BATDEDRAFT_26136 [Batrachochytrium dendrobatidis JAM81]EGF78810.1 hypothetical protein BATDEDRAFT_26136 [Batrachochytrium dendrobatidis JAM81]|eukprot:XP_006680319.1 hypothetical protein BATDEDRAFT_26136 [Batrachochytrium dendrobatidis JAM81]
MTVNGLIENNFISNLSINNQQLCKILLANITVSGWKYVTDSNCCQSILSFNTTRLTLTSCRGLIISKEKRNPDQIRLECQQQLTVCCYIKTRQYRPTQYNVKGIRQPDTNELFVCNMLHHIGMGPETRCIIASHSTKTVYIAINQKTTLKQTLWTNSTKEMAVSSVINSDTLVSPVPYTMSHIWTLLKKSDIDRLSTVQMPTKGISLIGQTNYGHNYLLPSIVLFTISTTNSQLL